MICFGDVGVMTLDSTTRNEVIMSLLNLPSTRQSNIALAILRTIVGIVFIAHGAQKLFVLGFDGVSGGFGQMGIPMAAFVGPLVALLEFFGGTALVLGALTRLVALALALTMVGATLLVHLAGGFFMPTGIEFTLTLFGASLALAIAGAGGLSLDAVIARRRHRSAGTPSHTRLDRAA